ncbi:MAG TPA: alpha/beta hydrolase domain-containing protein [Burkholderiales bacterium]|nr:alpha/beta hydrolase domain-containing protein [Burkholderiales bacterium]
MNPTTRTLACTLALMSTTAYARITTIEIESVEPFAPGTAFGDGGAYEKVKGTFRGELDPRDPRNAVIVNLDRAPRNAAGRVEYEADFFIMRPADPAKRNGKLIYDVNNRGRMNFHARFTEAKSRTNDPKVAADVGDGLFFRQGYTFAWSGWDPDAPGLRMKPVVATNNGAAIMRRIREEFVSGTRARDEGDGGSRADGNSFRLTYEAASLDTNAARLTVRRTDDGQRREVAATAWRYADARTIQLTGGKPEPGSIYELQYPAKNPRVLGIGMAATRDFVAFLRNDARDAKGTPNPAGTKMTRALAYGSSQSGRFLRDFVRDGFNQDEAQRKVFDGVMAHTAGVGGVFLNEEFGQPNRTSTQHEDHTFPEAAFPFSTARLTDPVTRRTGGLFRNDGFDPLWMETNTSTEYWQKGASLLTTDPLGTGDIELPSNARSYLVTGTQHNAGAYMTSTKGSCTNPRNPHNPIPLQRALFVALDEWVDGKAPPPSNVPRLADATLTLPAQLGFPAIPEVTVARLMNEIGVITDWTRPSIDMAKPYRPLVPQVDADGNELAGVKLPDIAVPLGTHTGWNLYRTPFPEGELCDRDGTYAPFARTRAERAARNDPRASIEERYGSHADYVKRYEAAVQKLVEQRYLLPEDAKRYVAKARSNEVAALFTPPVVGQRP